MADDFENKIGKLEAGPLRGKLVDRWKFNSPFSGRLKPAGAALPKLEVDVSLERGEGNSLIFVARGEFLREELRNTDINRLKTAVEDELRFQHDILTGVTWEDWLQVQVSTPYSSVRKGQGAAAGLQISYSRLKRGIHPSTNVAYTINSNGVAIEFPVPKKAGEREGDEALEAWGAADRATGDTYSYIPATAENLAALDELMAKLDEVRNRAARFLNQDTIHNTLTNTSAATPLLHLRDPQAF